MKKVITPEFRVSFPSVFTPSSFEGQEPKYRITMLFEKGTDLNALKQLAAETVAEKWPNKDTRPKNIRNPFRDGDVDKPDMDGYAGTIFLNASSKMKPGVVDSFVQPIIEEGEFYAGCYARATVTCYAYSFAGNNGVAFGLQNIQKTRDGDSFTGRSSAESDFTPVNDGMNGPDIGEADVSADDTADMFG